MHGGANTQSPSLMSRKSLCVPQVHFARYMREGEDKHSHGGFLILMTKNSNSVNNVNPTNARS